MNRNRVINIIGSSSFIFTSTFFASCRPTPENVVRPNSSGIEADPIIKTQVEKSPSIPPEIIDYATKSLKYYEYAIPKAKLAIENKDIIGAYEIIRENGNLSHEQDELLISEAKKIIPLIDPKTARLIEACLKAHDKYDYASVRLNASLMGATFSVERMMSYRVEDFESLLVTYESEKQNYMIACQIAL